MDGPATWLHRHFVRDRRTEVLASHLAELVAQKARVLDVGCGDGRLAAELVERRPDLTALGVELIVRRECAIEVHSFDGVSLPFETDSMDAVMLVDVLHHTEDPLRLLKESARVASKQILLKDHFRQGIAAGPTLALMDRIGNAGQGIPMPGNYLTVEQWNDLYSRVPLRMVELRTSLGLYPFPLSAIFERSLHFVASLAPVSS